MTPPFGAGLLLGPEPATVMGIALTASEVIVGERAVLASVRRPAEGAPDTAGRVRRLCEQGASTLLVVDAAVPVRPDWAIRGSRFALVADHLNLTADNPLVGPNDDEWGPRFPDMTDAWNPGLRSIVRRASLDAGIDLREGVLAGVTGSTRTAAEISMLRLLGADMASEGFVAEAITGRHAGRDLVGLGILSAGTTLPGDRERLYSLLSAVLGALNSMEPRR